MMTRESLCFTLVCDILTVYPPVIILRQTCQSQAGDDLFMAELCLPFPVAKTTEWVCLVIVSAVAAEIILQEAR